MVQKLDIQVYHECMGMHEHTYPQILVPLHEKMTITIGEAVYEVTTQRRCVSSTFPPGWIWMSTTQNI